MCKIQEFDRFIYCGVPVGFPFNFKGVPTQHNRHLGVSAKFIQVIKLKPVFRISQYAPVMLKTIVILDSPLPLLETGANSNKRLW